MEGAKGLIKQLLIYTGVLLVGVVIGLLCRPKHSPETIVKTETIVRTDTLIIEKPTITRYEVLTEQIRVVVSDTIRLRDTLYVALPIEKKTYKGEDYYAEISGYKPSLDRIEVYPKTTTITKIQTKTNHNSLALGAEMQYNGTTSIPIYLEYSHLLHKNVEMFGKVFYDVPSQQMGVGMGVQIQFGW